jgi:hypothetical protein
MALICFSLSSPLRWKLRSLTWDLSPHFPDTGVLSTIASYKFWHVVLLKASIKDSIFKFTDPYLSSLVSSSLTIVHVSGTAQRQTNQKTKK